MIAFTLRILWINVKDTIPFFFFSCASVPKLIDLNGLYVIFQTWHLSIFCITKYYIYIRRSDEGKLFLIIQLRISFHWFYSHRSRIKIVIVRSFQLHQRLLTLNGKSQFSYILNGCETEKWGNEECLRIGRENDNK